jgi:hypothetical protein
MGGCAGLSIDGTDSFMCQVGNLILEGASLEIEFQNDPRNHTKTHEVIRFRV